MVDVCKYILSAIEAAYILSLDGGHPLRLGEGSHWLSIQPLVCLHCKSTSVRSRMMSQPHDRGLRTSKPLAQPRQLVPVE